MIRHYEVVDDVTLVLKDGRYEEVEDVDEVPGDIPVVTLREGEVLKSLERTRLGEYLISNELVMEQL